MLGREHAAFGLVTSAAVGAAFLAPEFALQAIAGGVVGSLLPDIDLPNSMAGKIVYPVAWVINKLFGHRTITHDPVLWIPIGLLLIWKFHYAWVLGLVVGYWGHLLLDSFTAGGIPILWIFRKYKKGFHMLPYKWKIHANSFAAKALTVFLSIAVGLVILAIGTKVNKITLLSIFLDTVTSM